MLFNDKETFKHTGYKLNLQCMSMAVETVPVFRPHIDFAVSVDEHSERVAIVHCTLSHWNLIRIWPSTFLVQEDGTRRKLLQAFNITAYPDWKLVLPGHRFTLIFEGLDKGCAGFSLLEDIPEPGGFHIEGIARNNADVYWVNADNE